MSMWTGQQTTMNDRQGKFSDTSWIHVISGIRITPKNKDEAFIFLI